MHAVAQHEATYNSHLRWWERLDDDLALVGVELTNPLEFRPGQYAALGLYDATGRLVQRPMSIASVADGSRDVEFFIRAVPGGGFTPLLWECSIGDGLSIRGPKGRFVLGDEDDRVALMVATGTGLAPFRSMIATLVRRGESRRIRLIHGVSLDRHLAWRDWFERLANGLPWLSYLATVSQPEHCPDWSGPTGRVESVIESEMDRAELTAANTTLYLCGNPGMIAAVEGIAMGRGFKTESIVKERYWQGRPFTSTSRK